MRRLPAEPRARSHHLPAGGPRRHRAASARPEPHRRLHRRLRLAGRRPPDAGEPRRRAQAVRQARAVYHLKVARARQRRPLAPDVRRPLLRVAGGRATRPADGGHARLAAGAAHRRRRNHEAARRNCVAAGAAVRLPPALPAPHLPRGRGRGSASRAGGRRRGGGGSRRACCSARRRGRERRGLARRPGVALGQRGAERCGAVSRGAAAARDGMVARGLPKEAARPRRDAAARQARRRRAVARPHLLSPRPSARAAGRRGSGRRRSHRGAGGGRRASGRFCVAVAAAARGFGRDQRTPRRALGLRGGAACGGRRAGSRDPAAADEAAGGEAAPAERGSRGDGGRDRRRRAEPQLR
mmetsp:Transcript_19339/g.57299  ORF Transcript_19339/g.57299 Transcript_19339/m.57299 type:complete len:355 (+) Transcript_19339:332-1396(+)